MPRYHASSAYSMYLRPHYSPDYLFLCKVCEQFRISLIFEAGKDVLATPTSGVIYEVCRPGMFD